MVVVVPYPPDPSLLLILIPQITAFQDHLNCGSSEVVQVDILLHHVYLRLDQVFLNRLIQEVSKVGLSSFYPPHHLHQDQVSFYQNSLFQLAG